VIVADVQKLLGGFVGIGRNFGSGSEQIDEQRYIN
jgi:hypothetical protein